MASYLDLVAEGKSDGCVDWYGFAEWLTQIKEYFGDPEFMDESDAESCYMQARCWWEGAHA